MHETSPRSLVGRSIRFEAPRKRGHWGCERGAFVHVGGGILARYDNAFSVVDNCVRDKRNGVHFHPGTMLDGFLEVEQDRRACVPVILPLLLRRETRFLQSDDYVYQAIRLRVS